MEAQPYQAATLTPEEAEVVVAEPVLAVADALRSCRTGSGSPARYGHLSLWLAMALAEGLPMCRTTATELDMVVVRVALAQTAML